LPRPEGKEKKAPEDEKRNKRLFFAAGDGIIKKKISFSRERTG
jgi:hypothetical protein